jgi:ribosome maturation factor RimP
MGSQDIERKITGLIAADLDAGGYDVVRVLLTSGRGSAILQIMAERRDGKPMRVEDCAAISRAASAKLDADEGLIPGAYALEVSSPGIDRPLLRVQDYRRFAGHLAKIELSAPQEGRRRFEAKINKVTGEDDAIQVEFELEKEKEKIEVPFSAIEKARLVLTDALLKASKSQAG